MSITRSTLEEPSLGQPYESPEPLSITGTSVSPNHQGPLPFDSLEGSTVIQSCSGTPYYMKWYTSIYGSLDSLIGMAMQKLSNLKHKELE